MFRCDWGGDAKFSGKCGNVHLLIGQNLKHIPPFLASQDFQYVHGRVTFVTLLGNDC